MRIARRLKLGDWIGVLVVVLVCLVVMYLAERFITSGPFRSAFENVVVIFGISYVLAVLTTRDFFLEIMERVSTANHASVELLKLGITDATCIWNNVPFAQLLGEATECVSVYSIYSSTWINQHFDLLVEYLDRTGGTITFSFLNPDCRATASLQEKFLKAGDSQIDLATKIRESITRVQSLADKKKRGRVRINIHDLIPTYSLYRFDTSMVFVPYLQSPGRSNRIPAFVFKNVTEDDLFSLIKVDVDHVQESFSKEIYDK